MLTNLQAEIVRKRSEGMTFSQIAEEHGCSRQNIHQQYQFACNKLASRKRKFKYAGIRDFFFITGMSKSCFNRKLWGNDSGRYTNKTNSLFEGHRTNLSIDDIKKILEITGKTFEELFGEECE